MELQAGLSGIESAGSLTPIRASIIYAPFKRAPFGHVSILFQFPNGEHIVISPEAHIQSNENFSLMHGFQKNYRLRYGIYKKEVFFKRYADQGRKSREYELNLPETYLQRIYEQMLLRSHELNSNQEWYHTLANSCVTNTLRHVDEVRTSRRFISGPYWAIISPKSIAC